MTTGEVFVDDPFRQMGVIMVAKVKGRHLDIRAAFEEEIA